MAAEMDSLHTLATGASYLPEATGSQQIAYNLVLLPVPRMGGRSCWRDVDPAQALRAPREWHSSLDLEGLCFKYPPGCQAGEMVNYLRPNYPRDVMCLLCWIKDVSFNLRRNF